MNDGRNEWMSGSQVKWMEWMRSVMFESNGRKMVWLMLDQGWFRIIRLEKNEFSGKIVADNEWMNEWMNECHKHKKIIQLIQYS